MQILRLKTAGWGGLPQTRLTFSRRVNFLVGPNGSGKSTVIDALRLLVGAGGMAAGRGVARYVYRGRADAPPAPFALVLADAITPAGVATVACLVRSSRRRYGLFRGRHIVAELPADQALDERILNELLRQGTWYDPKEWFERVLLDLGVTPGLRQLLSLPQGEAQRLVDQPPAKLGQTILAVLGAEGALERFTKAQVELEEALHRLRRAEALAQERTLRLRQQELELTPLLAKREDANKAVASACHALQSTAHTVHAKTIELINNIEKRCKSLKEAASDIEKQLADAQYLPGDQGGIEVAKQLWSQAQLVQLPNPLQHILGALVAYDDHSGLPPAPKQPVRAAALPQKLATELQGAAATKNGGNGNRSTSGWMWYGSLAIPEAFLAALRAAERREELYRRRGEVLAELRQLESCREKTRALLKQAERVLATVDTTTEGVSRKAASLKATTQQKNNIAATANNHEHGGAENGVGVVGDGNEDLMQLTISSEVVVDDAWDAINYLSQALLQAEKSYRSALQQQSAAKQAAKAAERKLARLDELKAEAERAQQELTTRRTAVEKATSALEEARAIYEEQAQKGVRAINDALAELPLAMRLEWSAETGANIFVSESPDIAPVPLKEAQLSGGWRAKVSVLLLAALALAAGDAKNGSVPLLILDEHAAALDERHEDELGELLGFVAQRTGIQIFLSAPLSLTRPVPGWADAQIAFARPLPGETHLPHPHVLLKEKAQRVSSC